MKTTEIIWRGDELLESIAKATDDVWWDAIGGVKATAVAKAPVDRGDLRESGYMATNKRSDYKKVTRGQKAEIKPKPGEAVVGFSAIHSHLVEFGTSHRAAKPYLRPAFDEEKATVTEKLAKSIREKIE